MRAWCILLLFGLASCGSEVDHSQANGLPGTNSESSPPEISLHVGQRATLKGLAKAINFNGKSGRVRQWSGVLGKYYVKIDGIDEVFTVKPDNLEFVADDSVAPTQTKQGTDTSRGKDEMLSTQSLAEIQLEPENSGKPDTVSEEHKQIYSVSPATHGTSHDHNHNHRAYRSDLSGRVLAIGHWYHKKGDNYDITDDEFKRLSLEEQTKYIRINTRQELDQLLAGELDKPVLCAFGAKLEPGQECVRDAKGHHHIEHLSDVSHKPLLLGKWYHKKGEDYDINSEEFEQLKSEERSQFALINKLEDLKGLTPIVPPPSREAPPSSVVAADVRPVVSNRKQFVTYHSDISGQVLELGKWYHMLGQDKDISSEEWAHLPEPERVKFVRIDAPEDIEQIEKEQWVRPQNDLIRAEQSGILGLFSATVKRALGAQADVLTSNILKYANREESMYKKAKFGFIQHIPTPLQHPGHTFAGVRIQPTTEQPLVKDSGVTSANGLAVKVAIEPPDYVVLDKDAEGSLKPNTDLPNLNSELPVLTKRAPQGQPISNSELDAQESTPPSTPDPAFQTAETNAPYVQESGYTPSTISNDFEPASNKKAPRGKVVTDENLQALDTQDVPSMEN